MWVFLFQWSEADSLGYIFADSEYTVSDDIGVWVTQQAKFQAKGNCFGIYN